MKGLKVKILFIAIFIIRFIIFCDATFCEEIIESNLWFRYADEYIKADEVMLMKACNKKETFSEDYNARYRAESKLVCTKPPTIYNLKKLLSSQNIHNKKVALVNIMIRHIYSEPLFNIILKSYENNDDYFVRFYSLNCLKILNSDQIKQYENDLLNIMSMENNEAILTVGMPIFIKIDELKIFPFFIENLKNGSKTLRSLCYVYLKKMGNEYYTKAKKQLETENATEALNFIRDAELGKKPR